MNDRLPVSADRGVLKAEGLGEPTPHSDRLVRLVLQGEMKPDEAVEVYRGHLARIGIAASELAPDSEVPE